VENQKAESVFVVDIIGNVLQKVAEDVGFNINYVYGDAIDVVKNLKDKDESVYQKETKYVLAALYMPFIERRGSGNLLYADVTVRRMLFATITNSDDEPMTRYQNTFKPILYPVYESFLLFFARDNHISSKDPNTVIHTKSDVMSNYPIEGMNDFVDCIILDNFQFSINQSKFC
jgi:hypothetical protein